MGEKYLIDTNVIIDFSENKLSAEARAFVAAVIDSEPYLSVIDKIELLGFSGVSKIIVELVDTAIVIGLTDAIIQRTIAIRKLKKIKLPGAIIAATAIEHKLQVITRNVTDFQNIKGLKIINP
jgi:hypothetical protein